MPDENYVAETADLEKRAEEYAPGVLDLLEVYGRATGDTSLHPATQDDLIVRQSSGTTVSAKHPSPVG